MPIWTPPLRGGLLLAALGLPLAAGCQARDSQDRDAPRAVPGGYAAGRDRMPGDAGRVGDPARTDPTPLTAAPPDRPETGAPAANANPEEIHGPISPTGPRERAGTGAGPSSGDAAGKEKAALEGGPNAGSPPHL